MNKVIIWGRLGADPEVKSTQNGGTVCNLRVATNERTKDKDGNWGDHTEWHRVTVFGKSAENCGQYLSKGKTVLLEGKLRTNKWQAKDGSDRWTTEVIAFNVTFTSPKDGGSSGSRGGGADPSTFYGGSPEPAGGGKGAAGELPDDDIPF